MTQAVAVALVGAPIVGIATSLLIGAVWVTCGGVGDSAGISAVLGLPLIAVPVISIAAFVAAMTATLVTRRSRPFVALASASLAVLIVAAVSFGYTVPYPGAADFYASIPRDATVHCQTNGMPDWWPVWLPF